MTNKTITKEQIDQIVGEYNTDNKSDTDFELNVAADILQARGMLDEAKIVRGMINDDPTRYGSVGIGDPALVLTVSYHFCGQLVAVLPRELVFVKASWLGNTGRFHQVFEKGLQNAEGAEIERLPAGQLITLNRNVVVAMTHLPNLPTETTESMG